MSEDKKIISVLLTRNHGLFSNFLYITTGRGYTHAAIGLGEGNENFYSFNYKGFVEEHPGHRKTGKRGKESLCFQFRVSREEYDAVKEQIDKMLENRTSFHYNKTGVISSLVHIPVKRKDAYFCSEFVAEMLKSIEAVELQKQSSLYLPNRLVKELAAQPNVYRVIRDSV